MQWVSVWSLQPVPSTSTPVQQADKSFEERLLDKVQIQRKIAGLHKRHKINIFASVVTHDEFEKKKHETEELRTKPKRKEKTKIVSKNLISKLSLSIPPPISLQLYILWDQLPHPHQRKI